MKQHNPNLSGAWRWNSCKGRGNRRMSTSQRRLYTRSRFEVEDRFILYIWE